MGSPAWPDDWTPEHYRTVPLELTEREETMDEKISPLVRLWWMAEDKIPGLLPVERRFWRIVHAIRHPRAWFADWLKWHNRPRIGDAVRDCRHEVHTVVRFGDTEDFLIFEDGHSASWMSCCDRP